MRTKIIFLNFALAFLTATKAWANINGSTLQSFNPTSSNGHFVTVHQGKTLAVGSLNFGGFLDFAHNTLPPALDLTNSKFEVSNDISHSDLHLAVGLFENIEVGASVGSLLSSSVDNETISQYYESRGLTDFRLNSKINFLTTDLWAFAINLQAQFPQIENDYFYGSGGVPLWAADLIATVSLEAWTLGANLGYNLRPNGDKIVGGAYEPVGDTVLGSLAAAYTFSENKWSAVGEAWAAQPTKGTANYSQADLTAIELLAGLKYKSKPNLEWQAGYTHGLQGGVSSPDYRVYLGLNWMLDGLWNKKEDQEPVIVAAPAPPVIVPPAPVVAPAVGNFVISNFNFKTGSSEVSADYTAYLKKFAEFINAKPSYKAVVIKGFTDNVGPKSFNVKLSEKRAEAIKTVLVQQGKVPAEKVQTIGFGMENPIAPNTTVQGRKLNRRIELVVEE